MLFGPTASGKSGCALEIARRLPCEIISVDSAAVYRGMDAGTAKPSPEAQKVCPHHLIDMIDPTERYSAARFCVDAGRLIAEITARGRVPLLVGGTMLYAKALLQGIDALPEADAATRAEIDRQAGERGWPAMHAELARLDPATAARLGPNDSQRIQRALEVLRLSGQPLSELIGSASGHAFRFLTVALLPSDRSVLHTRIASRFDAMLAAGLVDEVKSLRRQYLLARELPSMRCVGYRQVWEYLENEIDGETLRTRGITATRQLAKRQLTWLRAMPKLVVFDCLERDLETQAANFVTIAMGA